MHERRMILETRYKKSQMRRYPCFRVRLAMEADKPYSEDNTAPVPVLHTKKRTVSGGEQTAGHMLRFRR